MAGPTSTGASNLNVANLKDKAQELSGRFNTSQKALMGGAVVVVFIAMFLVMKSASKTELVPLFSNLKPADAAAVTEKLTAEGGTYELADGGATIMVSKEKVYDLRIALAAEGLPQAGPEGYSLLDKQGITASEFSQQVGFQRAMEGELTKTIGTMDPIASSTVHLAIPKDDVFATDKGKATASVLVKTKPGKTLDAVQVQAIVHLVASSVQGLDPTSVTVADSAGNVLAEPGEDGGANAANDINTKQRQAYEKSLSKDLEDLIRPVVGANKSKVTVSADLDFSQRKTTSETFQNPSGDPNQSTKATETAKRETYTGAAANGDAGPLGPDGAPVAGDGTNPNTNYDLQQNETKNALNRAVEETKAAPGGVRRLSVAVLVDAGATSTDQVAQIQNLVTAGAGISPQRGDTVQVSRMSFGGDQAVLDAQKQAEADAKAAEEAAQRNSLYRQGAVALFLLGLLAFAYRALRKAGRRNGSPGLYAGDVREITPPPTPPEPLPIEAAEIELPELPKAEELFELPAEPERSEEEIERDRISQQVEEMIDQQPAEVAQMLRGWLDDGKVGSK